jgi:hypothetical protein
MIEGTQERLRLAQQYVSPGSPQATSLQEILDDLGALADSLRSRSDLAPEGGEGWVSRQLDGLEAQAKRNEECLRGRASKSRAAERLEETQAQLQALGSQRTTDFEPQESLLLEQSLALAERTGSTLEQLRALASWRAHECDRLQLQGDAQGLVLDWANRHLALLGDLGSTSLDELREGLGIVSQACVQLRTALEALQAQRRSAGLLDAVDHRIDRLISALDNEEAALYRKLA